MPNQPRKPRQGGGLRLARDLTEAGDERNPVQVQSKWVRAMMCLLFQSGSGSHRHGAARLGAPAQRPAQLLASTGQVDRMRNGGDHGGTSHLAPPHRPSAPPDAGNADYGHWQYASPVAQVVQPGGIQGMSLLWVAKMGPQAT